MPAAPRPHPVPHPLSAAAGLIGAPDPGVDVPVTGITHDSRQVRPGDLYAALPGFVTHGARFADRAAAAGAVAVLTDAAGRAAAAATGLPLLVHPQPRSVLGRLAAWVYDHPAHDLLLVGVTGTNGKTTVTHLAAAGLAAAGHRTGVIGTVGTLVGDELLPTERTTPEATDLHALLAVMRERGVTAVAMEISSHALVLGRVDGLVVDVAVFTNLTQDHLDFHGDLESYFTAKADLFTPYRSRLGVVCTDDGWGERLARTAAVPVTTYAAAGGPADWQARSVVSHGADGSSFRAVGPDRQEHEVTVRLPGAFNVANALGTLAALRAAGVPAQAAVRGLSAARAVPGRLERVPGPGGDRRHAFVDYAHTPDAVARVLTVARGLTDRRVVAVLGCGGDRDRDKRPRMGALAAQLADVVVVTDDNPRSEDPAAIRASMLAGAAALGPDRRAEVLEIADRRAAIRAAVHTAGPDDIVLVLGKGHEQGQEVAGTVLPFDDCVVLADALREAPA